jgi:phosphohistidine phosphatase
MKTLHLLRHAKSAWDEPGLSDRERVLNKRGQRDAPRMGLALAARMDAISVTVSPARRAQLTLQGMCAGWPALARLSHRTDEALYTFSVTDLLAWLCARADDRQVLFIIGHNPAFTEAINFLAATDHLANLPTAGYVQLGLRVDRWRDLRQGCGYIEHSLFPRQL